MDMIVVLPKSHFQHDVIVMVVDILTKVDHFILGRTTKMLLWLLIDLQKK